jgi:hypothetical protein
LLSNKFFPGNPKDFSNDADNLNNRG